MTRRRWLGLGVKVGFVLLALGCAARGIGQNPGSEPASAHAQGQATKAYRPGEIHVDQSRVYIFVGKTGLGHEHAVMGRLKQGAVRPGAVQDVGTLVFDMTSFTADADEARRYIGLEGSTDPATRKKVNANMLGPDVLDVAGFPTATCVVRAARPHPQPSRRGLPQWELDGEFTLHGVARPIQLIVDIEEQRGWTHARGRFTIRQSDYGITPYSTAFGAIGVSDSLDIYADLWVAGTDLAHAPAAVR